MSSIFLVPHWCVPCSGRSASAELPGPAIPPPSWSWLVQWCQACAPVVVPVVVLVAGLLVLRHRRLRQQHAAGAEFWEITPPYRMPADGAMPLWRLVAGHLGEHPRDARVGLQLWTEAADGRVHAGLWVAGGTSVRAMTRAVDRAWPGAGLARASAPSLPLGPVAGTEICPQGSAWAPVVDHEHRADPRRATATVEAEDEPLRAVLATMSDLAGQGRFASVQVIVSRVGLVTRGGWDKVALGLLRRGVLAVLDMIQPGGQTANARQSAHQAQDPFVQARQRAEQAKRQMRPHLRATVRLVVAGAGTRRSLRYHSRELARTLSALTTGTHPITHHQLRRPASKIVEYRHGNSFIASMRELAALWHLPQAPARHGLPRPDVQHRRADAALPRLDEDHHDHRPGGTSPRPSRTRADRHGPHSS